MRLATGVQLLRVLSSRRENALTTVQIGHRWRQLGGSEISLRSIQRYMSDLSNDGDDGPAIVAVVNDVRPPAYYLRPSQVSSWFVTEEDALELLFSRQVMESAFGQRAGTRSETLTDIAEGVVENSDQVRRLRDHLRIVPDGIGRLRARIERSVLQAAIDAIAQNRQLDFVYGKPPRDPVLQRVSPLGLIAKDGTIYLVGVQGLSDTPRHYALQRMASADVHHLPAQPRPDFDLDRHIAASHQFSHLLDTQALPAALRLRVAPEALFHFEERPLSSDQSIGPPEGTDRWHTVTASVPKTVLLIPFLVSMGPWVAVLAPADVRSEMAAWIQGTAAHYAEVPP